MLLKWKSKLLIPMLIIGLLAIQYKLWFGNNGYFAAVKLQHQSDIEEKKIIAMQLRNKKLIAEIQDLKAGTSSVEAMARTQLGMVKKGEVYYRLDQKG